jgi:prevent-host-death family protein
VRTMSAKDAKNHFGELLLDAQRAPVTIEKNGRPVAVMVSYEEHEEIERMKLAWLKAAITEAEHAAERGEVAELDDDLMNRLLAEAKDEAARRCR